MKRTMRLAQAGGAGAGAAVVHDLLVAHHRTPGMHHPRSAVEPRQSVPNVR